MRAAQIKAAATGEDNEEDEEDNKRSEAGEQASKDASEHAEFSAPKQLKLAVIVDKLDQLHSIMRILSVCSPVFIDSRLNVAAMKFQEPSNTTTDDFIGLAEGRLIKVEQEVTTIRQLENLSTSATAQLLPLSMFCNALGIRVHAFDVRGDPSEFSNELKIMTKTYDADCVLFPWRLSEYNSMLFWRSLLKVSVPIALLVSRRAHAEEASLNVIDSRSNSMHKGDAVPDSDVENQNQNQGGRRASRSRANSQSDGIEMTDQPGVRNVSGRGRSTSITENLQRMLNINELEAFGYEAAEGGGASNNQIIKNVVCLITGQITDRSLLSLAARISERNSVHILVLISADKEDFSEPVLRALTSFQELYTRSDNVTFVNLATTKADQLAMASEVSTFRGELLLMSYNTPVPMTTQAATGGSFRVDDHMSLMVNYGMPAALAISGLTSPEIGSVATRLLEQESFENLLIFHEPNVSKLRRQTMSATATVTTAE